MLILQTLARKSRQHGFEIAVRALADGGLLEQAIQQQITALDGSVPIGALKSVESEIGKTLAYPRFRAVVLRSIWSLASARCR